VVGQAPLRQASILGHDRIRVESCTTPLPGQPIAEQAWRSMALPCRAPSRPSFSCLRNVTAPRHTAAIAAFARCKCGAI